MVGRGNEDDIEVLFLEHFPIVAIGARLFAGHLAARHHLGGAGKHVFVHVAERDDFDGRDLQEAEEVGFSIPAAADEADALLLVCEFSGIAAEGRPRQPCRAELKELPTVHTASFKVESRQTQALLLVLGGNIAMDAKQAPV